jgi:hypothetical protein
MNRSAGRPFASRPTLLCLLLSISTSLPASAQLRESPPPARGFFATFLSVAQWDDMPNYAPPAEISLPTGSGRFDARGYGLGVSWLRRLGGPARTSLYLGGEFAGFGHSDHSRTLEDPFGGWLDYRLWVDWGYIAPCATLVWNEGRPVQFVGSAGAGIYLVRLKATLEGVTLDSDEDDVAPGGFLALGVRVPLGNGGLNLHAAAKAHAFRFRGFRSLDEDRDFGGPATVFELGLDWVY